MSTQMIKANLKQDAQMLFWVIVSAIIHSCALINFSIPNKFYPGGYSGIARLLTDVIEDFLHLSLPFSLIYLLMNVLSSMLVYKSVGKKFTVFSIIQFALVSLLTAVLKPALIISDPLLVAVFGGIIGGLGVGIALSHGASSGGSDFLSVYFSNKYKRSFWNLIFGMNCVVLGIAGFIYGWNIVLYSIILQFCSNQVVKRMHKRYTHQTLTIITQFPDEVIESVFQGTRHGITKIHAEGAYLKQDVTMLYTVVNSYQTKDVIKAVREADSHAFINIKDSINVEGNFYQKPLD